MAKREEPREPVQGRKQIERQFAGKPLDPSEDIGGMTRAERAEKYRLDMSADTDADLAVGRGEMVARYRKAKGIWPDGPDSKYDRWYDPDDWTDKGEYIGTEPCVKAPKPEPGALEAELERIEAKIAAKEAAKPAPRVVEVASPEPGAKTYDLVLGKRKIGGAQSLQNVMPKGMPASTRPTPRGRKPKGK